MKQSGWIAFLECLFRWNSSLVLIVEKTLLVHKLVLLASSVDLESRKQGNRFSEMLLSSMMSHMSRFRVSKCCIFTPSCTQTAPSNVLYAKLTAAGIRIDLTKTPWSRSLQTSMSLGPLNLVPIITATKSALKTSANDILKKNTTTLCLIFFCTFELPVSLKRC